MQAWITQIMNNFGYWGILFLIFIENMFPPIPSVVILPLGGFATTVEGSELGLSGVIIVATIGSVVGAIVLYYIGTLISVEKLEKWLDHKYVRRLGFKQQDVMKTVGVFDKYGVKAVLFGRCVPIIRSLISVPAGMTKMNIWRFTGYTTVGSLTWNVLLVSLGAKLGDNWHVVSNVVSDYSDIVLILLIVLFAGLIARRFTKRKRR